MNVIGFVKQSCMIVALLSGMGLSSCSEETVTQETNSEVQVPEEDLPVYPAPDRSVIPAFPGLREPVSIPRVVPEVLFMLSLP